MLNANSSPKKCVVVEGNIGVGKSSFLKLLGERLDCGIFFEPLAKWQQMGEEESLFEKFYKDTKRWAYTFQSYAFLSRVLEQESAFAQSKKDVVIFERSVFSDLHCFAKNCFELGTMTPLEWSLYQEWFSWLVEKHVVIPNGFIYLQASPETCMERLKMRSRHEEVGVSIDYLNRLHQKHEGWLVKKEGVAACVDDVPVLVLDRNVDWVADPAEKDRLVSKVSEFLGLHSTAQFRPAEKSSSLSL